MDNYVMIVVMFSTHNQNYGFTNNILESKLTYSAVSKMIVDFCYENRIRLFDVLELTRFFVFVIDGVYVHHLLVDSNDIWPLSFNKISDARLYPHFEEK